MVCPACGAWFGRLPRSLGRDAETAALSPAGGALSGAFAKTLPPMLYAALALIPLAKRVRHRPHAAAVFTIVFFLLPCTRQNALIFCRREAGLSTKIAKGVVSKDKNLHFPLFPAKTSEIHEIREEKTMSRKEAVTASAPEGVNFRRLTYESIPEMWSFQFWIGLILSLAASVVRRLIGLVAEAGGVATTANLREVLLSWRSPILLILGAVLVLLFIVLELFAQILMNRDVLSGQESSVRKEVREALVSARRFLTPGGVPILLYIFIAVPLCGLGFSISLTESFHIPNFIMDVVYATPLYIAAYIVLILALLWFGFRSIFSVHAVLIDGMTPTEGRKESLRIIMAHGKAFAWDMFKVLVVLALIQDAVSILVAVAEAAVSLRPDPTPEGYLVELNRLLESGVTDTDAAIIRYRTLCAFVIIFGSLIRSIAILLCGAYTMLRFTRCYLAYSREEEPPVWRPRPKKARYILKRERCSSRDSETSPASTVTCSSWRKRWRRTGGSTRSTRQARKRSSGRSTPRPACISS